LLVAFGLNVLAAALPSGDFATNGHDAVKQDGSPVKQKFITEAKMDSNENISTRATFMRGGTSKGIFFTPEDLPIEVRSDAGMLDRFMLRVVGSPDPYGKQIDGMGAATSSTSKVVLVSKSSRENCDVDYVFGAVSIERAVVDWSGNCGNLTSAVGPFAIARGLVTPTEPNGIAVVRIWQANIGKRILAHVPLANNKVVEIGDFELDGVTFPAAEIKLEFLDLGADEGSEEDAMFPTGNLIDTIDVPNVGKVKATLINAGNPTIFVDAVSIGLTGIETQMMINSDLALLGRLEAIRAHATVALGMAASAIDATEKRPHTPKIAFVAKSQSYTSSNGKDVPASSIDIVARIMSMGQLHHAMTGTGAVAIAAAASIPGTLVSRLLDRGANGQVRFGHPSGTLAVGAEAKEVGGAWIVTRAVMSRTARRLMDGHVFVPAVWGANS
jgi:probable AcnD-accessory protein PrpF